MSNAKNNVSMTTAITGGAGIGQVITLVAAENAWNPTFAQAYGGARTDIPVSIRVGNNWQTCRCDFNGVASLTVQSIQSQFEGGVYNDTAPAGINLSGTPVAQVSLNADSLVDAFGALFLTHTRFRNWVDNPATSPTVDFATSNYQIVSNVAAGTIVLTAPAGSVLYGLLRVNAPDTITAITAGGRTVKYVNSVVPTWSVTGSPDYLSVIIDDAQIVIGVSPNVGDGTVITAWHSPAIAAPFDDPSPEPGSAWSGAANIYADDGNRATSNSTTVSTDILRSWDFSFDEIPDGSTILAIEVRVKRDSGGEANLSVTDGRFELVLSGVTQGVGKSTGVWNPPSNEVYISGGDVDSDTWGASPTPAMVKDQNFGFQIQANFNGATGVGARVNHVQMRIRYTTS